MKLFSKLLLLSTLLLSGCGRNQPVDPSEPVDPSDPVAPIDPEDEPEEEGLIDHITLSKKEIYLQIGKYDYLSVNFFPDDDTTKDLHDGTWSILDSSIATISQYGKVTGVKKGYTVASFTTNEGKRRANCTVYVYEVLSDITREYIKVTDADSIKPGDEIIFASPELGVAASTDRLSGYLLPTHANFEDNGQKLASFDDNAGSYIVGNGKNGGLTLENLNGEYLAGKSTTAGNGLLFVKSKGQINWIFEKPAGYDSIYCVNNDIAQDLWLMFNKISNEDIRFNLYDSNPTQLMIMPSIYRLTLTFSN